MRCPRCSNTNKDYFYKLNNKMHCRKCMCFFGDEANGEYEVNKGKYKLDYSLTKDQQMASNFVLCHVMSRKDCAVNAVCGAGKTEIIYETLNYCINNNYKVGIAIPRKDVVIELKERIGKDFNVSVVGVYGGHCKILQGDITIFTTHQSFRYINYFDVLIIDEVDAFPYKGNEVLKQIVSKISKNYVYLSATMPRYIEEDESIDKFYLNRRYHNYDIPIPICKETINMNYCLKRCLKKYEDKVVLVYFPTIKIETKVSKKIKYDYLVNSKIENRDEQLFKINRLEKGVVLTTTILERGITIKDVQVIVYNADHSLFDKDTLIQISGRVGRNKDFPCGNVIFICKIKSKSIRDTIKTLKKYNE